MFRLKIAIDLGTCNCVVLVLGRGIILSEPSVVAVIPKGNKVLAVGNAAKKMIGRTPEEIRVYRPLKDGVIADYRVTQAMIKYFIEKVSGTFHFLKPDLVISVPAGSTSTERRAVVEAAISAGAREAFVVKEPILAALGAEIPIEVPSGHLIVDIGGGTSEVAVISLGGMVTSVSARTGGDKMDSAIADFIKKKYNLAVGAQTAEEIKIKIGTAMIEKQEKTLEIRGRDLISGLPKSLKISSNEVCEAISDILKEISQTIKKTLQETPPELSADIMDKGMILSGGGALLRNIDEFISQEIGVPCFIAEDPLLCVAKGAGAVLENLDTYKKALLAKR